MLPRTPMFRYPTLMLLESLKYRLLCTTPARDEMAVAISTLSSSQEPKPSTGTHMNSCAMTFLTLTSISIRVLACHGRRSNRIFLAGVSEGRSAVKLKLVSFSSTIKVPVSAVRCHRARLSATPDSQCCQPTGPILRSLQHSVYPALPELIPLFTTS